MAAGQTADSQILISLIRARYDRASLYFNIKQKNFVEGQRKGIVVYTAKNIGTRTSPRYRTACCVCCTTDITSRFVSS